MTKTTKTQITAFTHCSLSGSRTPLLITPGTAILDRFDVDDNDPLYGEAVVWFKAKVEGEWTTVGACNLPVMKKGWVSEFFTDIAPVADEADDA